ncbi:MAG: hypothetical protein U0271_23655 [Polyangiaceae bacterium]
MKLAPFALRVRLGISPFVALALVVAACGDDGTGGSGAGATGAGGHGGGATGGGGVGGAGGSVQGGAGGTGGSGGSVDPYDLSECGDDTDCPGGTCVAINAGYRVCQLPVVEATMCSKSGLDECCSTAECINGGVCVAGPAFPFCGGAVPDMHNVCAIDQCANNADCGDQAVCVPPGTVGNKARMCVYAECFATCGQKSLRACALVRDSCCGAPDGFFCINDCHVDADCPGGYCQAGTCMPGGPACPP